MNVTLNFFKKMAAPCLVLSSLLCSLACSSKIKIQTEPPEVSVLVGHQNSSEHSPLGKTPLTLTFKELSDKIGAPIKDGDFMVLTFQAKDFETEKMLLPTPVVGTTETNVFLKMKNSLPNKESSCRVILQRLHNAQKYAQASLFERAIIETDKVLESDPRFERALAMKGSIYYLQKNYNEALKWFDEALRVDPAFDEALKMVKQIKSEMKK